MSSVLSRAAETAELSPSLTPIESALIAEGCTKSSVVWLRPVGGAQHHLVWHVWHADAVHVVCGEGEQQLPELPAVVELVVPSKDRGSRLATVLARVEPLTAGSPAWEAAADALAGSRLNTQDVDSQRERWATGARLLRVEPLHLISSGAGDDATAAVAAAPPPSPATTVGKQPLHLRNRAKALRMRRRGRGTT